VRRIISWAVAREGVGDRLAAAGREKPGISMLSDVAWTRRNMVIFAVALSVGLGLQLEAMGGGTNALQHLPDTLRILGSSGILPAALIAIVLNLVLPEELASESTEDIAGGMAGHGRGSLPGE